jgi:hypothetical protein
VLHEQEIKRNQLLELLESLLRFLLELLLQLHLLPPLLLLRWLRDLEQLPERLLL